MAAATAAAAVGNHILLLYKRSILVSGVTGKLTGLCFVALFSMAQSCGAARISTRPWSVSGLQCFMYTHVGLTFLRWDGAIFFV